MSERNQTRDQQYSITYPALTITRDAVTLGVYLIGSALVVYLAVFVPLSFLSIEQIKPVWDTINWILWIIAFFSAVFYIGYQLSYKKSISWLYYLAFVSNWLVWCFLYVLSFLGLFPASGYIPLVAIITGSAFFLFGLLFFVTLGYNHYLSRSMSFAQRGSLMLALIAALNLFLLFGQGVRSILSWETLFSSSTIVFILQLVSLVVLAYFTANIQLNDPRQSRLKMIVSLAICLAVVVAKYLDDGFISFWWLGMASSAASVFYVAHSPTQRKSNWLAVSMFSMMTIAVVIDSVTYRVTTDMVWNLVKDFLLPVIGIVVTIVVGFETILKTLFPNLRSAAISRADVAEGSQDFIDVDGYSVDTLDQIMAIALISGDYSFCKKLLDNRRVFPSNELYEYFEIYYYCVQFNEDGNVTVPKLDENRVLKRVKINQIDEFRQYINDKFPPSIQDAAVWQGYAGNELIPNYLDEKLLNQARPKTVGGQFRRILRTMMIVGVMIIFLTSQILSPLINVLPEMITRITTWNTVRRNETRLLLATAMQPYSVNDPDLQTYYAYSMWNWVQSREQYLSRFQGDLLLMESPEMREQIDYLEEILEMYPNRDEFYYQVANELGLYAHGLDDCRMAMDFFALTLGGKSSTYLRDTALARTAECMQTNDPAQARDILMEASDNTEYVQSRAVLAELYYADQDYSQVVTLLQPLQNQIDAHGLVILGESQYWLGDYAASKAALEQGLPLSSQPEHVLLSNLFLGAANHAMSEPFLAADHFYRALSGQVCPYNPVFPEAITSGFLPEFREAIDAVRIENPNDFRVNLWDFVYYLYTDQTELATQALENHMQTSPDYEREFVDCLIEANRE